MTSMKLRAFEVSASFLHSLQTKISTYFRRINAIWLPTATGVLRQLDSVSQIPAPVAAVQER
jgi:hypothetical protein